MKNVSKLLSIRVALVVAAGLAASTTSSLAQGATATISDVAAGGGVFDYTILLQDTGSTSLNSFWYAWTTSGNNLPLGHNPTRAANTLGWANDLDGNSIQWVNSTGTALAPGQSGTFTFVSTATPSAITTSPSGESVAYVNGITFTQDNPGDSTPVFSPTLVAAPEPSPVSLLTAGLFGLAGSFGWRRFRVNCGWHQIRSCSCSVKKAPDVTLRWRGAEFIQRPARRGDVVSVSVARACRRSGDGVWSALPTVGD